MKRKIIKKNIFNPLGSVAIKELLKVFILIIMICSGMSYNLTASDIILKSFTHVQNRMVIMGDIIENCDDLPYELYEIPVKKINRPGIKVIIPVKMIRKVLEKKGYDYTIIHPDKKMYIRVEIPVVQIDYDDLNEIVYESIQDDINLQSDEKMEIDWRYSNLKFPKEYDIVIDKYSRKFRKVYVTIFWDGTKLRTLKGKVEIKRSSRVIIAKYELEKGHKITADDITEEVQYSVRKIPEVSFEELLGKVLIKRHRSGEIIKKAYLKKELIVMKGQKVRIAKVNGSLRISLSGIALNSGGIGDMVKVKTFGNRNTYSCFINSKNKIEIY